MPDNGAVNDWAETDLAWELAEIAGALITDRDRIDMYTAIGAGHSYTAIKALLDTVGRARRPVSPALAARLDDWIAGYAAHEDAPRLRRMRAVVDVRSA
jgi:hypothetical protein